MSDNTELKRLAEAAIVALDKYNADECNYELAEAFGAADDAFHDAAGPATVLALIAELDLAQTIGRLAYNFDGYKAVLDERDQLRAEVAGLRTGYEAYEQVNAELKAESDSQRKDLQNLRTDNAQLIYALKQQEQSYLALKAKNEALRKDAERYRWLRDSDYAGKILRDMGAKYRADADQRIDAALGQGEQFMPRTSSGGSAPCGRCGHSFGGYQP